MSRQLLGQDADGLDYYLEDPSWDCGWYWGFGYIVSATSFSHADGEYIMPDPDKRSLYTSRDNDTNIFTGRFLKNKTFTDEQGWKLRELMATFYQIQKQAELVGRGGMHISSNPLKDLLLDKEQADDINERLLPKITGAVMQILKNGEDKNRT